MKLKITKQKPDWSEVPHNKRVVVVTFPNCDFKWIPTWKQLRQIKEALREIEAESWGNIEFY